MGFVGVATVFDAINADHEGKLLPGVGAAAGAVLALVVVAGVLLGRTAQAEAPPATTRPRPPA